MFDDPNKPATEQRLLCSHSQIHRRRVTRASEKRHGFSQGETFTGTYGMERFFIFFYTFISVLIQNHLQTAREWTMIPDSFLIHPMIHFPLAESDACSFHKYRTLDWILTRGYVYTLDRCIRMKLDFRIACKYANQLIKFQLQLPVSLFSVVSTGTDHTCNVLRGGSVAQFVSERRVYLHVYNPLTFTQLFFSSVEKLCIEYHLSKRKHHSSQI